jgi:hypothetical protein
MFKISLVMVLFLGFLHGSSSGLVFFDKSADDRATALVRSAIEKMGGEGNLRSLQGVQIEKIGHTYSVEQSERPEGPWLVNYDQVIELRDYANQRLRRATQTRSFQAPQWRPAIVLKVADGAAALQFGERSGPAQAIDLAEAEESLALSAERVLLTALEAKDLRAEADTSLQGSTQHVVAFGWRDGLARIYLNGQTGMPTAIEVERAYPGSFFWGPWGDVKSRVYLSLWTLEAGGLRYPRQWDSERNGTPYQSFTVTSLTINPQFEANSFSIPTEVKKAFESSAQRTIEDTPLGHSNNPAVEIAPGVVQIPGAWNVTLVRQSDGVVVIEAPISSGYSDKVLAEAKKRFPGLPIKAVISTSDAWPHIGGVRVYAAREIPVYALDLNGPILERLIASPRHFHPDALERQRKKPKFRVVSNKTIIGSGPNRLELYPVRSESGERMMMVYFPEHKLLYGSDLVQQRRDGSFFMPEYLSELIEAVRRERVTVSSVFAMHTGVRPWSEIEGAVTQAKVFPGR